MDRYSSPDLPILDSAASVPLAATARPLTPRPEPLAGTQRTVGEHQLRFDPARFPASPRTLPTFLYLVEIVGLCNLRCPSCPVGSARHLERPSGMMSVELYEAILEKIIHESPGIRTTLALYNWGEPLLHPELPRMIEIAHQKKIPVGLSSNLVHPRNLKEVVKARPSSLRVSVSGYYPQTYNQTHMKGDVNLVKSNLYRLRSLMDQYYPELSVGICYHLYRHNCAEDFVKFQKLAEELNFEFKPVFAIVMNIEKLLDYFEGEMTEQDRNLVELLLIKPEEQRAVSEKYRADHPDCVLRREQMVINHDGTVPLCCGTYAADKTVAQSFLDVPHARIQQGKYEHSLCSSCQGQALHISGQYAGEKELFAIAQGRMRK